MDMIDYAIQGTYEEFSYNSKYVIYSKEHLTRTLYTTPVARSRVNPKQWTERGKSTDASSAYKSMLRTKKKVMEIALCNEFEWFVTLTFNPEVVDSFDYELTSKKVSKWLNNVRTSFATDMKYLMVAEQHKTGRFHFHGLFANTGSIEFVDSGTMSHPKVKRPRRVSKKLQGKYLLDGWSIVYNMPNYKFGWSTATKVKNSQAVSYYLAKYITKDLCQVSQNKKRYWASRNLEKPIVIKELIYKHSCDEIVNSLDCDIMVKTTHFTGKDGIVFRKSYTFDSEPSSDVLDIRNLMEHVPSTQIEILGY